MVLLLLLLPLLLLLLQPAAPHRSDVVALSAMLDSFAAAGTRNIRVSLSSWYSGIAMGVVCTNSSTNWAGVTCSADGRVIELNLGGRHLKGPIPGAAISSLPYLHTLDLSRNSLSQNIPASIVVSQSTRLKAIVLSANSLTGTAPFSLCLLNMSIDSRLYIDGNPGFVFFPPCLLRMSSRFVYDNVAAPLFPSGQPTGQPTVRPSSRAQRPPSPPPSSRPTLPTGQPSGQPTTGPTLRSGPGSQAAALGAIFAAAQAGARQVNGLSAAAALQRVNETLKGWERGLAAAAAAIAGGGVGGVGGAVCTGALLGVTCDASGTIVALELGGLGLVGSLPSLVGLSAGLTRLSLRANSFRGPISPISAALFNIRYLDLSDNPWASSIPADIFRLPSLAVLNLKSAKLTGTLPTELLIFATALEELRAGDNPSLSGSLPRDLSPLTRLAALDLSQTGLTGLISASLPTALTWLDLSDTRSLSPQPIPASLAQLSRLSILALSDSRFTGAIPDSLPANLSVLFLDSNSLRGAVPDSFCALKQVSVAIDLSSNPGLTQYPACLDARKNVNKDTSLPSNALETADAKILCDYFNTLPPAGRATLAAGGWCGAVYADAAASFVRSACGGGGGGGGSGAQAAWLGVGCAVVGAGVGARVTSLNLAGVALGGGSLPASLGGLAALSFLDLAATGLGSSIPSEIAKLQQSLVVLALDGNQLSSTIPSALGALSRVERLWLQQNALVGTVPPQLGGALALTELWLNDNSLTGMITKTLCRGQLGNAAPPLFLFLLNNPALACIEDPCLLTNKNLLLEPAVASRGCAAPTAPPTPRPSLLPTPQLAPTAGPIAPGVIAAIVGAGSVGVALGCWLLDYRMRRAAHAKVLSAAAEDGVDDEEQGGGGGGGGGEVKGPGSRGRGAKLYWLREPVADLDEAGAGAASAVAAEEKEAHAEAAAEQSEPEPEPEPEPGPQLAPELQGLREHMEGQMRRQMDELRAANDALREQLAARQLQQQEQERQEQEMQQQKLLEQQLLQQQKQLEKQQQKQKKLQQRKRF